MKVIPDHRYANAFCLIETLPCREDNLKHCILLPHGLLTGVVITNKFSEASVIISPSS